MDAMQKLVDKQRIPLSFMPQPIAPEQRRQGNVVRMVLLEDSLGTVQMFLPANGLLDLSRLCETCGRNLQAMSQSRLSSLLEEYDSPQIPAIPGMVQGDILVDNSLLEQESLYLESGEPNMGIPVSQSQFTALLDDFESGSFSTPINTRQDSDSDSGESLERAVNRFTTLRIKQRLEETLEIPPLPNTADRIIKLRGDPDASIADLVAVIEVDPTLSAQVVSWASSPYYGAKGNIHSVHDAIMRVLGFDLVINMALGITLGKTLNIPKDGPRGASSYWETAFYTASVMEKLVSRIPAEIRPKQGLSYLCGLLHNFGYLLLAHIFPPYFSLISRHVEVNPQVPSSVIDQHLIGVSRNQMNAWLMAAWHMPEELVTAIRWQDSPAYDGDHHENANLLHVSLQLLRQQGVGDSQGETVSKHLLSRLGLTEEDATYAIETVMESSEAVSQLAAEVERYQQR